MGEINFYVYIDISVAGERDDNEVYSYWAIRRELCPCS